MKKPVKLKIHNKEFTCQICQHNEFHQDTFQITSGGLLAQTKERPTVLICTSCGYLHWFLPQYGSSYTPSDPN